MDIVIKIDNEHYERIMRLEEGVTVYPTTLALYDAVKNGTPLEILDDGTLSVTVDDYSKVKRVLVQDNDKWGGLFYADSN